MKQQTEIVIPAEVVELRPALHRQERLRHLR